MARSALFLIAAFVVAFAAAENVVTLTSSNFDDVVSGNDFVLVEFYAPWCGHCKSLAPEYEKSATTLKDKEGIVLAKVDATEERELGERFGVSGFPTLKFFRSGNPVDYDGPRKADGITNWVLKKSGPATQTLANKGELEIMTDNFDVVVVGAFGEADGDAKDSFTQAALAEDGITFAVVDNNAELAKELGMTVPSVYVHKNFDEGRADYTGDLNEDDIAAFVAANKLPLVIPFTNEKSGDIFGSDVKVHLLMFSDDEQKDTHEAVVSAASPIAKEYQGKALFVTVSTEHDRIMEFFGISADDLPTMRLVSMGGQMRKYSPSASGVNTESIASFMKAYFADELKPELKSEDVPETQEGPVYVLVGKNFDDVVINNDKDVLVEFYAPWCGHCKSLAPIYDAVAERFAHIDSVVIAKMDATANEHEAVEVEGFPTIKFWKSGAKSEPIDYNGSRDEEGFVDFLKENAGVAFDLDAEAPVAAEEDGKEEL